ncbi:MAG: PAS domain S-box protein [Chitinophagaceae bacterium]|nr:PAS domain S-box protein [Chitinophagaceae bacterium]
MGILVADEQGEIILANQYLLGQFGYAAEEELVRNKVEMLIPKRYQPNHPSHRDDFVKKPHPIPWDRGIDLFAVRKDGSEFPVEISLSNYNNDGQVFVIAFINDITRRKEIEQAMLDQKEELAEINLKIEELNDDLEQKVELRTHQLQETLEQLENTKNEIAKALSKEKELSDLKSRFVSMASHEFRTPLSTILSSASLLAKYTEGTDQEKRDKHIHRIKSAVNNLTDILNEFLSIGKIEDGKLIAHFTEFNIKDLAAVICNEMQAIAKDGQVIGFAHSGPETVCLDPTLLRNVIINLLSNAIKFTPELGRIHVSSKVTKDQVLISVKDSGLGISTDDQEHLFERFFRGANVTNIQGTGLGLHIVGKYIELMNGSIEFTSVLEQGTEFIITFNPAEPNQPS